MIFKILAHLLGHIHQVFNVLLRDEHHLQPGAVGSQHFFAQAADRQHTPAQGDLSGHTDFLIDRSAGQCRDERGCQGDAGRWAVLRNGAFRHVHVDIHALEDIQVDAQIGCA